MMTRLVWLKSDSKKITRFHGGGAFASTYKIPACCHVGGASLPRTAGAAAASACRTPGDAPRIECSPQYGRYEVAYPVGRPEDLDARQVRKEERTELENVVLFVKDFVGVVHATLKQAMKAAENQKQPIAVTHLQHEFDVTHAMDQELRHFLISRTEGEEIVRGAERETDLEQRRRLAALYDPLSSWEESGRLQANLVSTESRPNRRPLARHPSLGKFGTTPPRTHCGPVA